MMRYNLTDFAWNVIEPVLPKGRPCAQKQQACSQQHLVGAARVCAVAELGLTRRLKIASTAAARPMCGIV